MLAYKKGNILDSTEEIIVHGCNSKGKMGKGVAKAIRDRWPSVYQHYSETHRMNGLRLGDVIFVKPLEEPSAPFVANAITQDDYRRSYGDPSKLFLDYEALETALQRVNYFAKNRGITTIALPKIGSKLAGGDWALIEPIIEKTLGEFQTTIYLFD